ncbi:unnamed protein product [Prorocentrum cordatum]|uniref:R3H domain-containing protein n=1 Tax=Prorocentrum cordatum TaxID=2364126 RepID=A0ABN9XKB8_9DINO|nr:unnamed protein product [Polarella glacialis]
MNEARNGNAGRRPASDVAAALPPCCGSLRWAWMPSRQVHLRGDVALQRRGLNAAHAFVEMSAKTPPVQQLDEPAELARMQEASAKRVRVVSFRSEAVHEIAAELGLSSVSNGRGPQRYVSVAREDVESPSPIPFAVGKQASPDPAESDDEGSAEGLEPGIPALFREHASGSYGGGPIFMRAGDMDAFLQELEEALPSRGRRAKNPRAVVNSCYEDVIQLQLDFGVKTRQGLTKQWFQVFVQKAAASLGMSCMGMLLAMGHGDA